MKGVSLVPQLPVQVLSTEAFTKRLLTFRKPSYVSQFPSSDEVSFLVWGGQAEAESTTPVQLTQLHHDVELIEDDEQKYQETSLLQGVQRNDIQHWSQLDGNNCSSFVKKKNKIRTFALPSFSKEVVYTENKKPVRIVGNKWPRTIEDYLSRQ